MREREVIRVVGAAIFRAGRCLVARRSVRMSSPGKWELPGGKPEPGESPASALARELREELGLDVVVGEWLGRGEAVVSGRRVILDAYACTARGQRPVAHEHDELRWVGAGELDRLDWALPDVPLLPVLRARLRAAARTARHPAELRSVIAADWSVSPRRRAVYVAQRGARWQITAAEPPSSGWSLAALVELAQSLRESRSSGVLIAIDAVLGVPMALAHALGARSFRECIDRLAASGALDADGRSPRRWAPEMPFFHVPAGAGGLERQVRAAGGRSMVHRQTDLRLGAKSVLALAGIPGTVGSGSRALWKELLASRDRSLALWPFAGELDALARAGRMILGEAYPRAAHSVALAASLPAAPVLLAKRNPAARALALARLKDAAWIRESRVALPDLAAAGADEDRFDALMTAAALVRLLIEGRPLALEMVDPSVEGGILATGGLRLPAHPGEVTTRALFTYGTLAVPEVMEAVTGRRLESRPASIDGFERRSLCDLVYPGIFPSKGSITHGMVYLGLDADTVNVLDLFEGDLYERRTLRVRLEDGTAVRAETYVVRAERRSSLLESPWDLEEFRARHLRRYLTSCRRFRASLR